LTLTFKLVQARGQTRLPCEFGANAFCGSGDISYTNKNPQTDGAKNRTFRSSLRAAKIKLISSEDTVRVIVDGRSAEDGRESTVEIGVVRVWFAAVPVVLVNSKLVQ